MQIYKMVFNIIVTILALIWKNRCKCVFNMKIFCFFKKKHYICKCVQRNTLHCYSIALESPPRLSFEQVLHIGNMPYIGRGFPHSVVRLVVSPRAYDGSLRLFCAATRPIFSNFKTDISYETKGFFFLSSQY